MRCNGGCCGPIKLWRLDTGERLTLMMLCDMVAREQGDDVAKLKALLSPSPSADDVHELKCRAFDAETRRCTVYDERPKMCRNYPQNTGQICKHCGAWSDAEARGVALQVVA